MPKKVWTRTMTRRLKAEYPTTPDVHQLAEELGVTYGAIKSRVKKLGLHREFNVPRHFTPEEDDLIRQLYPDTDTKLIAEKLGRRVEAISDRAARLGIRKTHEYNSRMSKLNSGNGMATRFKKGQTPPNKGKRWSEFMTEQGMEASRRTQFRKGHVPHNVKPVGYESIRKGVVYVKVEGCNRMVQKSRYVYEQTHGSIPEGMCISFKDGDSTNCTPDNLMLITEAEKATRVTAAETPENRKRRIGKATATRNKHIARDKMLIRWGFEPKGKLVKRWRDYGT